MKIRWTHAAIKHLTAIYEYIAQDSPVYAQRTVDKLTRRSEQLAAFPYSGRKVPEYETDDVREIIEVSYRLIYRLQENQIDILAVIHGAQKLPPEL